MRAILSLSHAAAGHFVLRFHFGPFHAIKQLQAFFSQQTPAHIFADFSANRIERRLSTLH